ncbi:MAG: hypothetical protein KME57_14830 [Scytonema hyalinum WJT4-NPBG1]|nr:hypothetical protein [Scytonema hyalinum WJT4-NPBG1]
MSIVVIPASNAARIALTVTSYQLPVTSYQFYRWGKHHTNWTESVGGGFKSPTKASRHCGWYCSLI